MSKNNNAANLTQTAQQEALAVYLKNRKQLDAARERLVSIQEQIDKAAAAEAASIQGLHSSESLDHSLESTAAALAIGQITDAEAASNHSYISEQRRLLGVAKEKEAEARRTRVGLERMKADLLEEITRLKVQDAETLKSVLMEEAEAAGVEYMKAAQALVNFYLRLITLGDLLARAPVVAGGKRKRIYGLQAAEIFIPTFSVSACGMVEGRWRGALHNISTLMGARAHDAARESESSRLRALGVALPGETASVET